MTGPQRQVAAGIYVLCFMMCVLMFAIVGRAPGIVVEGDRHPVARYEVDGVQHQSTVYGRRGPRFLPGDHVTVLYTSTEPGMGYAVYWWLPLLVFGVAVVPPVGFGLRVGWVLATARDEEEASDAGDMPAGG